MTTVLPEAEVLVVDNASTDATATLAYQAGATVIHEPWIGKGAAMRAGAACATRELFLYMDGDSTYRARDLRHLAELLEARALDAVYGIRPFALPAMTRLHQCGNWILSQLASWLYGPTKDLVTGMVVIRADVWRRLPIFCRGFDIDAELFIQLRRGGYRVGENPISYRGRAHGSKLRPWRDGWRYVKMLVTSVWQPFCDRGAV